jgi:hypothetical protein
MAAQFWQGEGKPRRPLPEGFESAGPEQKRGSQRPHGGLEKLACQQFSENFLEMEKMGG